LSGGHNTFKNRTARHGTDGALGSALWDAAVKGKWVTKDLDSRAIRVTNAGRRELLARFGLEVN